MADKDFGWAIPVMRAGYAGRALVYLAVAGLSLWAIWRGGNAQGTSSALSQLQGATGGTIVLALIALGLFCYALWRLVDSLWDLECYGSDGKGLIARAGMIVTGLVHLALGVSALFLVIGSGSGGGGSGVQDATRQVMEMPAGRWLVGIGGVLTLCASIYYFNKALTGKYRQKLRANHFTLHWNRALQAGVIAQGVIVAVIGGFLVYAAVQANAGRAGGVGKAFDWLASQPFGNVLVVLLCIGLLGFALFCAVNAAYRIVPAASGNDVETLARKLKARAS
jgi:hypothetical protein